MKLILKLLTLAFFANFSLLQAQDGQLKIADEFPVSASANIDYNTNNIGLVYEKEFRSTNAGYVKIHFNNFISI